jgi:hypothetical protein
MATPKNLTDLKFQDNVLNAKNSEMVQAKANQFFADIFDNKAPVMVRILFTEDDKKVYECYQDSGSNDYLYIIK